MALLPTNQVVRLAAGDLGVRIAGAGAPLLLLHGMGGASASWREQFADFASDFTVAAWDAPGYGASADVVDGEASAEGYAELVDALAREIGFTQFHLVGHSLGALVAAAFAALRPERLTSLTLSALPRGYRGRPDSAGGLYQRVRMLEQEGAASVAAARARNVCAPEADPATIDFVQDVMSRVRPTGYRLAADLVALADPTAHLPRIETPTLFLVGEHDSVAPPAAVAELAALLPGHRREVIAGAGHAAYVERPSAFNTALRRHIEAGDG